jgi:cytochrome c oxidase assembly protein subunit 11
MATGKDKNRRTALALGLLVVGMFGFGFAMIPLYGLLCQVAGIQQAKLANAATASPAPQTGQRTVLVKFDATVNSDLPWRFQPLVKSLRVPVGKMQRVDYEAENLSSRDITGQAIPSFVPWQATPYFSKSECFCFKRQNLKAGEKRKMPLAFWVSPDLPENIDTLTLSYTFMNVDAVVKPDWEPYDAANGH